MAGIYVVLKLPEGTAGVARIVGPVVLQTAGP
jgi:hypothetical protein